MPLIKDVERNQDLYCPNSCGLFYAKSDDQFLPIAIQLVPGDRNYLFTADESEDWLLAKMYYRCSMSSVHEVSGHPYRTIKTKSNSDVKNTHIHICLLFADVFNNNEAI